MKTFLFFVVGFAVLAVAVSRLPAKELQNETDEANEDDANEANEASANEASASEASANEGRAKGMTFEEVLIGAAEWALENDAEYRDAVNATSQPAERPKSKNGKRKLIPPPNSLALKSDPIKLGQKIAKLDDERQDKLVDRLQDLIDEDEYSLMADFYGAAIDATTIPEEATKDWKKAVKYAKKYGKKMAKNFPGIKNLFRRNTSLAIIDGILEADPLDAAEKSGIPIKLHIGKGSSGSLVVTSSFNTISSTSGKVKGTIQRLILDRIEENGGVDEFYQKFFSSPEPNPEG